jgi:hypothetical protein
VSRFPRVSDSLRAMCDIRSAGRCELQRRELDHAKGERWNAHHYQMARSVRDVAAAVPSPPAREGGEGPRAAIAPWAERCELVARRASLPPHRRAAVDAACSDRGRNSGYHHTAAIAAAAGNLGLALQLGVLRQTEMIRQTLFSHFLRPQIDLAKMAKSISEPAKSVLPKVGKSISAKPVTKYFVQSACEA